MSDIQGQLSLQNKLLQSIKDELAAIKRAATLAEKSREERFEAAIKKMRGEFDMDRLDVMAENILAMANTVYKDSLRMKAIMDHLGIPDVESDEGGPL